MSRGCIRCYRKKAEACGARGGKPVLKYERKSTKRKAAGREGVEETEPRKSKVESEGMKYASVSGW